MKTWLFLKCLTCLPPVIGPAAVIMKNLRTIVLAVVLVLTLIVAAAAGAIQSREQEAFDTAVDAYIYLYPLVTMEVTRLQLTNVPEDKAKGPQGPMNEFHHFRAFPDLNFKAVVRPNFDTLYSILWADMTREPIIVSVPDSGGRYYLLPMLDMWTDVFASPGWRTTGTKPGHYAYVPPGWQGKLPDGVMRIDVPTPYGWMIGRTQTNGPKDYGSVHKFQDGLKVTPLSQWGKKRVPGQVKIDPAVDMKTPPLTQVNSMSGKQFFEYAARLMTLHPPHVTDTDIVARMKRIGIVAGQALDFEQLDPVVQQALQKAPAAGLKAIKAHLPMIGVMENGWTVMRENTGVYGVDYLQRATITLAGLGCNKPVDAVYPLIVSDSAGKTPEGNQDYVLHFDKDELPPAQAFWSLTMYDKEGFQVANPINRYAIGDRDALHYNADGSLDIYIQAQSPGKARESNWLPSPKEGTLGLTMRLYAPKRSVLDGSWKPPVLQHVGGTAAPARLGDGLPSHK
jgi:hypothetical protein